MHHIGFPEATALLVLGKGHNNQYCYLHIEHSESVRPRLV